GNGAGARQQPLEHRLGDRAADLLLVGPDRLHLGGRDGGAENGLVDGVEIGGAPGRVRLAAERHQNEAQGRHAGTPAALDSCTGQSLPERWDRFIAYTIAAMWQGNSLAGRRSAVPFSASPR